MSTSAAGPEAHEHRRRLIVTWHALGHDALDGYDVPRFEDGLELTIAERIERLAGRPPERKRSGGIALDQKQPESEAQ